MRATIAIASLDEGDRLDRTVESCLETTADLECEVLVADDASEDGSVERLRRRFPGVRVVRHAERRGVAATKDLAARCARGDVLVFLDAHCKPEPGAVARLVADVEELDGRAVVTPRVAALDVGRWRNDEGLVGHGFGIDLDSFDVGWKELEELRPYRGAARRLYAQPTFIGCCVALSRDLYDGLWGFDTGMRSWGTEDVDLGVRAWLLGHPVLHDPEPLVGHRFRAAFDGPPVPTAHVLANRLRMARKVFGDTTWLDWLQRSSERTPAALWEVGWAEYLKGHESVERERAFLHARRVRDEFWYAREFGQPWPGAAGLSPAPAPGPGLVRPPAGGLAVSPLLPRGQPPHVSPSPRPIRRPGAGLASMSPSPWPARPRPPRP
jgi:GT2 family glycosyltransferase